MERHTKIVATIGPASEDRETLERLIQAGMNVARMNFSHGTQEDHMRRFNLLRELSRRLDHPVTILQDLQGPKIRVGGLATETIELRPGQSLTLLTEEVAGTVEAVSVDFPDLPRWVRPGSRILLADGQLELQVTSVANDRVETRVIQGGTLSAHKGVNLPDARLDIPGLTAKDEKDLQVGLALGVDAVAMSFVRTPQDILRVREAMAHFSSSENTVPVIAKLERPEALENLEAILEVSDGVMVARGDLGVEMPPEAVPIAQKRIIEAANRHERVVITATQMLESMIDSPRPTRAEASDVANAIFDGSDAVMLSGETAVGKFPLKAVHMMDAIIRQAEVHLRRWGRWQGLPMKESHDDAFFITRAACEMAHDRNVRAITVFTQSGRTALMMSKARPEVPILAFTPEETTYRRLPLYWGVTPYRVQHVDTMEAMLACVENTLLTSQTLQPGHQVILVCGFPVGSMRPPNLALLHTIGQEKSW